MTNEEAYFFSEMKQWYNLRERKLNNVNEEIQWASKTRKTVNGKASFTLEDSPDYIIEASKFADTDFFPNTHKLLILGVTSSTGSTETENTASWIRWLNTPYQSTIGDKRESDLNVLPLQRISNIQSVAQIFIKKYSWKMFKKSQSKRANICKILKSDSHLPKKFVLFASFGSPLKMIDNAFYFILKTSFVLKIFKFLSWLFGHVEKAVWLER